LGQRARALSPLAGSRARIGSIVRRRRGAALLALVLLLPGAPAAADPETAAPEPAAAEPAASDLPPLVETTHTLALASGTLAYGASAGVLPVRPAPHQPEAQIFYVAYTLADAPAADRPLTFLVNGGPGAASAFLHLGGIGPRRLAVDSDGTLPAPPVGLADNPFTWLAFTDLVFVDPVGTGYSRVPEVEPEAGDAESDAGDQRDFWGVTRDLESLGEFIRLYLTRTGRWPSPKVVAGESYGGFRVAALAKTLPEDFSIAPNGAILISPLLDYAMLAGNRFNLLPWVVTLPSLAATAAHHGRGALAGAAGDLAAALAPVERFALTEMLTGLAGANRLPEAARQRFQAAMAAFTGLPEDFVARRRGRVPIGDFAKQLLRDQERLVGRYDGTISGPDPYPERSGYAGGDPSFAFLTAAYAPAMVAYLRDDLQYLTDAPYRLLNRETHRRWDFSSVLEAQKQGFAGFSDELRFGLVLNPSLRVLIAHGYHDLVTPYFASRYLVDQMDLPAAVQGHVRLRNFSGGHMFYLHAASLEALHASAAEFFADLPG
jgi:carboxypeptidase C (cathepsin A)